MTTFLRVTALFVTVVTVGLWFFGGFNLGKTRTLVPVEHPGPDGRTVIVQERRFLPGADFLAVGLVISGGMLAASYVRRPACPAQLRS